MVVHPELTTKFFIPLVIILLLASIVLLSRRKQDFGWPLLVVSAVVLALSWRRTDYLTKIDVFLIWYAFLGAFICGKYIPKSFLKGLLALILLLEIACAAWTRTRPWWLFSPGEYAAFGLLSIGLTPWPLSALALLATGARSAWVGLIGALAVKYARKWSPVVIALAAASLIALRTDTVARRFIVWREALSLWLASPLVGYGAGGYRSLAQFQPRTQHADNIILTLLVEFGLIGLASFAYLFYEFYKALRGRKIFSFGLCALLLMQLLDFSIYFIPGALVTGLCLAAVLQQSIPVQVGNAQHVKRHTHAVA